MTAVAAPEDLLLVNLSAWEPSRRPQIDLPPHGAGRVDLSHGYERATVLTPGGASIRLHPSDDPVGAAEAFLDQVGDVPVLVMVGLGLGFVLDGLERRNSATRVLAIEPLPAIARAMLARRDWRPWITSGRLTLLVGPTYSGAADAWRVLPGSGTPAPVFTMPLLAREFPEAAAQARRVAGQAQVGAEKNEAARRRFAGPYLLNTLANLPVISAEGDVAALTDRFADVPAVVVGAGPSLDRNIEELRRLDGRYLLIAVDTATRALLAAGLTPHLVVAVDPSEANARHLRNLRALRGAWFVGEPSLDPEVFAQFAGRTFTFRVSNHQPWPWLAQQGHDRGELKAWGSVLTTAFDLAQRAGCNPIVFAGADLAYTGGALYCRNTVYEPEWSHLTTDEARAHEFRDFIAAKGQTVEQDVNGAEVLSAPRFLQFRDWLVGQSQQSTRRILNGTGAGILMGGRIEQVRLTDLDLEAQPGGHAGLRARLDDAWHARDTSRPDDRARLVAGLSQLTPNTVATWTAFTLDTVTGQQIVARLGSAPEALAGAEGTRALGHMLQAFYDAHAQTPEQARDTAHANYEQAARKAPATQAHLLLEYLERTYPVDAGGTVLARLGAAASSLDTLRVLDVGCGVGRLMVPLAQRGIRVDGVDVSGRMLDVARENPQLAACELFLSNGSDCGAAEDGAYDIVYSHLCFRYLPSRRLRRDLLRSMARALRPGGLLLVQLRFYPGLTADTVPAPHVPWSADNFEATVSNGEADAYLTPDELSLLYADVREHVCDVRLQFVDVPGTDAAAVDLMVTGRPLAGLAERLYDRTATAESLLLGEVRQA